MNTLKRSLSLLMAVILLLSMAVMTVSANDEEDYVETDPYIYDHGVTGDGYDGPEFQYFSPYLLNYIYEDTPHSYHQIYVFSMYNTLTHEVVPAYCTDINVGAYNGHSYRRQNLEDSTYAADAASQIRTIMLNGFYPVPISGETIEEHNVRAKELLQELSEASGIEDLTVGEAISGTQAAIWQAAHGTTLSYTNFVSSVYTSKQPSKTKYYDLCHEERASGYASKSNAEVIAPRIEALCNYLLSLEPVEASHKVVSPESFLTKQISAPVANGDGTYNITVSTTIDVEMAEGDDLTVNAMIDKSHHTSASLHNGKQKVTLVLENIPAELAFEPVTLAIDGNQTVFDVFLFDAEGDRSVAQTMVGMENARSPVHTSILAVNDRILNFYKTTKIAVDEDTYERYPLEGIVFDLYFIASIDDINSGNIVLPKNPVDFAASYEFPETATHTVITDADGRASVNFTHHGLPDGQYLVVERSHDAIEAPVDPFYIRMPDGDQYEITVEPKNTVKGNIRVDKDVVSVGNDSASVDAYAPHTWIVSATVPEDIANGKSFVLSDTLDNRLDYLGNVKVDIESADRNVLGTLSAETDYVLAVNDVDSLSEDSPCDSFTLELTADGMSKIAEIVGTNVDCMMRVYFDAQINANAQMGEEIPNQATLEYTNSVNFDFSVKSDKPVVYTGGANLLKVDANDRNVYLQGATFEVYRNATADEVAAGENLLTIPGVVAPVIKVSFFNNAALQGDKVTSVTSDENGKVAIYGLAYGDYYLYETEAPAGYNLLGNAVSLTIDSTTHMDEMVVTIENYSGTILPDTGGIGTTVFMVIGGLLMLVSVLFLVQKKRMHE